MYSLLLCNFTKGRYALMDFLQYYFGYQDKI